MTTRQNADPAFAAKNAERAAERMRRLNADPAFNRLAALSPRKRETYNLARKKGFSKDEAWALATTDKVA
jgi:hypothetical protein